MTGPRSLLSAGYPSQVQIGGIPARSLGYSPVLGWSTPPRLGQEKEYLLRGGQYASCIHVGGLSCSKCFGLEGSRPKYVNINFPDNGIGSWVGCSEGCPHRSEPLVQCFEKKQYFLVLSSKSIFSFLVKTLISSVLFYFSLSSRVFSACLYGNPLCNQTKIYFNCKDKMKRESSHNC